MRFGNTTDAISLRAYIKSLYINVNKVYFSALKRVLPYCNIKYEDLDAEVLKVAEVAAVAKNGHTL